MGAASECSCAGQAAEAPVASRDAAGWRARHDEHATLHEDCPAASACAASRFWRKRVVYRRFTLLRAVGIYIVTATMMHTTYTGTRTMPNKDQGIALRRRQNFGGVHVDGASIKRDGSFPKQTLQRHVYTEQCGRAASNDQRKT
jgi:hypothetical protein